MKGREYHEDAFVGVIGKNIETEGGDKVGKVTDVLITKGTKEIVVKVSQGLLKSDMVVPWSKVVKVTEDTVVVSDRYYEGEAEGEVELQKRSASFPYSFQKLKYPSTKSAAEVDSWYDCSVRVTVGFKDLSGFFWQWQ